MATSSKSDSYFLHNEQCPRCRSKGADGNKDNLAVYSDGHRWCYKCSYYVPGDRLHGLKQKTREVVENVLEYPDGCEFSEETLKYLKSFGLTNEEIHEHLKGHLDGYVYTDSNFYLIRRLHKTPKVIIKGNVVGNEPIILSHPESTTVSIVEDILSAIKVGRVTNSCALLKTSIHDSLLYRLALSFKEVNIWLDGDMHRTMIKDRLKSLQPYFDKVRVILSEHDPKSYSTKQIKEFLL